MVRSRSRSPFGWREALRDLWQSFPPVTSARRSHAVDLAQLEDRILLSATPLPVDAALAEQPLAGATQTLDLPASDQPIATEFVFTTGPATTPVPSERQVDDELSVNPRQPTEQEAVEDLRHELIFVDTAVKDYQLLLDDLLDQTQEGRRIEVILLDLRDGIDQITEALARQADVDAIHLISHGTQGQVKLGSTWLNMERLPAYAGQIASWNDALRDGGDLLIYGCDLATTPSGRELVEALGALTGADVAASVDATGLRTHLGNWDLEYRSGPIETAAVFDTAAGLQWNGLLQIITVTTTNDVVDGDLNSPDDLYASPGADGLISLREAIMAANNRGGADEIVLPAGTYVLTASGGGDGGRDLDIQETLKITGAGSQVTTIDGNLTDGVIEIQHNSGTVLISGVKLQNGRNDYGAGIYIGNNNSVTLTDVEIVGNEATSQGGGIYSQSALTLERALIRNNSAPDGGGLTVWGNPALIVNTTFHGNQATGDNGGGIFNVAGTVTLWNTTISGNTAVNEGGGLYESGGTTQLYNSILAGNTATSFHDLSGSLEDSAFNIIGSSAGGSGYTASDLLDTDPLLGPLQDNGGPTQTMALLPGSPAINGGASVGAPTVDQRSAARFEAPDVGAYEVLPAIVVVDTASDLADGDTSSIQALYLNKGLDGRISLREAILATNATPNGVLADQIHFAIPTTDIRHHYYRDDGIAGSLSLLVTTALSDGSIGDFDADYPGAGYSWYRITVSSALPALSDPVKLDATTQPGYAGKPVVELRGLFAGGGVDGLRINAGDSTVRGLVINQFSGNGVSITGAGENQILGNYIGTDVLGLLDRGNQQGLLVTSDDNVIGGTGPQDGNVIGGNADHGILLVDADRNLIVGNRIGVGAAGPVLVRNDDSGIALHDSSGNIIGGTTANERNVISSNNGSGIELFGSGTTSNLVQGNYIGTDATGTLDMGNGIHGIWLHSGASDNTIGGTASGAGNLVSGNNESGIQVEGSDSTGNVLQGNYIGTNASGTAAIKNRDGIVLEDAPANIVGGITVGAGNIISGNDRHGLFVYGSNAAGNLVQGNYIGLTADGALALANGGDGIRISDDLGPARGNTIGGSSPGAGNVISGNAGEGIRLENGVFDHIIHGNRIGTDATGTVAIGNTKSGIRLTSGARSNSIGGASPGEGNLIGANLEHGIHLSHAGTDNNLILGNLIGLNLALDPLGNLGHGILLESGASQNLIGGIVSGAGNQISHNGGAGVAVTHSSSRFNSVRGNSIHANAGLAIDLQDDGVTANDNDASNSGPNQKRDYPTLTDGLVSASDLYLFGFHASSPDSQFAIDLYASPSPDSSGYGEGKRYLGSLNVTTDAFGQASLETVLLGIGVSEGEWISATATDEFGNTSEMALSIEVEKANSAPVLDTAANLVLADISEDAGVPVGAVGTLVKELVDLLGGPGHDNVTDADADAETGIAVTAADTLHGSWFFSLDDGNTWSALGSVAPSNARLLAADAVTRLYFQGSSNYAGTMGSALTIRAWDRTQGTPGGLADTTSSGGITAFSAAADTVSLTVLAQNDDPFLSGPLPASVLAVEDQAGSMTLTMTVADVDAAPNPLRLTLTTASGGQIWAAADPAVTIAGSGTTTVSVTGQLADVNSYLADSSHFSYQGAPDLFGTSADTITVTVNDLGNTGSGGGGDIHLGDIAVHIAPVNDDPWNAGTLPASIAALEDTPSDFALQPIAISDLDAGAGALQLRLTTASGSLTATSTADVMVSGAGTQTLILTGTLADLNSFVDQAAAFRYLGAANDSGLGADTLQVQVRDLGNTGAGGGGWISFGAVAVDIAAVNDDPVNQNTLPANFAAVEDLATSLDLSSVTLSDVDVAGGVLRLTLTTSSGGQIWAAADPAVAVSGSGTTMVSLTGQLADLNIYLSDSSRFLYQGTPDLWGISADTISVIVNDLGNTGSGGGGDIHLGGIDVHIAPVNDDPWNAGTLPATMAALEDTPSDFGLQPILISDADAAAAPLQIRLTTASGSLTAASTANVMVAGAGTQTLILTGTLADLNTFLDQAAAFSYLGAPHDYGPGTDTIQVHVRDLGNTGSGGGDWISFGAVAVDIAAVNDDPLNLNALPANLAAVEDLATSINLSSIALFDVDSAGATLRLTLTLQNGGQLLAFDYGSLMVSHSSSQLVLQGTAAELNTYLDDPAHLKYQGLANQHGPGLDLLRLDVSDLGNVGLGGGGQIHLGSIPINVAGINDQPELSGMEAAQLIYAEDSAPIVVSSGIEIRDIDDNYLEGATIWIDQGFISGQDRLLFVDRGSIEGHWDAAQGILTLTGHDTVAEYEAALRSIRYRNYSQDPDTALRQVSYRVSDGALYSNVVARSIQVVAVNDAPRGQEDRYLTLEGQPIAMHAAEGLLANDHDFEHSPLQAGLLAAPAHGTVAVHPDGSFVYQPADGFYGVDVFTYQVSDGQLASGPINVIIRVQAQIPLPRVEPEPGEAEEAETVLEEESGSDDEAQELATVELVPPRFDRMDTDGGSSETPGTTRLTSDPDVARSAIELTVSPLVVGEPTFDLALERMGDFNSGHRTLLASLDLDGGQISAGGETGFVFDAAVLLQGLDEVRQNFEMNFAMPEWMAGTALFSSLGMSAGYILWSLRGGYMIASLLSAMPAWTLVDPLPVLEYLDGEADEDDESLQSMLEAKM